MGWGEVVASRAWSSGVREILSCFTSLLEKGASSSQAQPRDSEAIAAPCPRPWPYAGPTYPSTYWCPATLGTQGPPDRPVEEVEEVEEMPPQNYWPVVWTPGPQF